MTYVVQENSAGWQAIATASSTQNHKLGTIIRAADATRGGGEFIYLKGVTSTAVGSWVTYSADDYTTTLLAPNAKGPVAVAMSACDASTKYGWYQISGKASALAADVSDSGVVYIDTVSGQCDDAFVSGDLVFNAAWASDDDTATGLADVRIARSFVNDGDDNDTA